MPQWNETVPPGISAADYYESRVPAVLGIAVTCIVVSVLSVALRFIARHMGGVKLWWDDWFALANLPSAIIQPVVMFLMIENGLGRNPMVVVNTDPSLLPALFPKAMAACTGIIISLAVFKLSALALYYRVFSTAKELRWMCLILGGLIGVWFVVGEILNFFRCMPDIGVEDSVAGPCAITDPQWNYYVAIPTVLFDFLVVALPMREVWKLHLQRYQRIAVIGIFALGSTVTAVSCYKVYLLAVEVSQHQPWSVFHLAILAAIEIAVGTLGCSITTYTPFIHLARLKLGLSNRGSSGNYLSGSRGSRPSRIRSHFSRSRSGQLPLSDESIGDHWELQKTRGAVWDSKRPYQYGESLLSDEFVDSRIGCQTVAGKNHGRREDDPSRELGHGGVLRTTEIVVERSSQVDRGKDGDAHGMPKSSRQEMKQPSPSSSELEFAERGA